MITPPTKDGAVELKSLSAGAGSTAILPQDVKQVGSTSRERTRMVVGITSDQTCLVLNGRLRKLRLAGLMSRWFLHQENSLRTLSKRRELGHGRFRCPVKYLY